MVEVNFTTSSHGNTYGVLILYDMSVPLGVSQVLEVLSPPPLITTPPPTSGFKNLDVQTLQNASNRFSFQRA